MSHLIPSVSVQRFTAAPAPTTVTAAKQLQTNIRDVLGEGYETFLQGSYKNGTSIPDMNDVDIVAVRRQTVSGVFVPNTGLPDVSWRDIFAEVQQKLEGTREYRGKTSSEDKCITVTTQFQADVVPAVKIGDVESDPVSIYSWRGSSERKNFPRTHYDKGVAKQSATGDRYKETVRMFKRWAAQTFGDPNPAPSFYIECLIYNFHNSAFLPDPAERFAHMLRTIIGLNYSSQTIWTVAGDKDIFTASEWKQADVDRVRAAMTMTLANVEGALTVTNTADARRLWLRAFQE